MTKKVIFRITQQTKNGNICQEMAKNYLKSVIACFMSNETAQYHVKIIIHHLKCFSFNLATVAKSLYYQKITATIKNT